MKKTPTPLNGAYTRVQNPSAFSHNASRDGERIRCAPCNSRARHRENFDCVKTLVASTFSACFAKCFFIPIAFGIAFSANARINENRDAVSFMPRTKKFSTAVPDSTLRRADSIKNERIVGEVIRV
jgi:hypothetical protein